MLWYNKEKLTRGNVMSLNDYYKGLAAENSGFGSFGVSITDEMLRGGGNHSLSTSDAWDKLNVKDFGMTGDTLMGLPSSSSKASGGFMNSLVSGLGNDSLMTNLAGVGQLGLGLASYLSMKPVYEEQLKGLKQNRQFAAADQQRRDTTRTNFDKTLG